MKNTQFVKVWNIAIRIFHWALVGCFTLAFISSENIPKLHVIFGYSVLALVIFRILYGFVGPQYARFSDFLYLPAEIGDYLKGLLIGRPKHYIGHNPAGGLMIAVLLLSLLSLTLTGLKAYGVKGHGPLAEHEISFMSKAFADNVEKGESENHKRRSRHGKDFSAAEENEKDEFWEEVHETIAYFTLFLVSIHIAGALLSSIVHRENLIKAMITGRKQVV
jgi:cytochrome b